MRPVQERGKVHRYEHRVDSIVDFIETTGIAAYVYNDPEQLRLLGKDVIERMLKL